MAHPATQQQQPLRNPIARTLAAASTAFRNGTASLSRFPKLTLDTSAAEAERDKAIRKWDRDISSAGNCRRAIDWNDLPTIHHPQADSRRASMNRKEVAVAVAPAAEPEPERSLNLPFGESEAEVVVESPLVSRTPSSSSSLITKLPTELICAIAMKSGFFTAINLMHTCRTLRTILSAPEAWATYYNPDMSDEIIENTLSVTTKLTQFDHLVFGTWSGLPGTRGDEGQRREGEDLFFEHRAFDTDFDFLGGISAKMSRGGMLKIQFFEHRTTLPCYLTDIQTKLNSGELAPTHLPTTPGIPDEFSSTPPSAAPLFPAATLAPPTGLRIPHTCPTCTYFDTQTIHKSTSLLDHNMFAAPTLLDDAITWVYTHLDNRRRVKVKVHAYQGPLGYVSWRDLPMVHCNEVRVAGRALRGWAWEFWRDVVERV